MISRALIVSAILCLELGCTQGEAFSCYSAESIPRHDRRFFTFDPSNVRSNPPIECVFVFGGPSGTRLRMSAYDLHTAEGDATECGDTALRVYDVGSRGLQLVDTYCGLMRRGQVLTMSSNMAIVIFTSNDNDMGNAFNLVVDTVERETPEKIPCQTPATEQNGETSVTQATLSPSTTPIPGLTPASSEESMSTSNSSEDSASSSESEESSEASAATTNPSNITNETESNDYGSQENATESAPPNEAHYEY